ncbi:MAG: hypothetical protein R3C68_12195 [Myxococcota bacterium]
MRGTITTKHLVTNAPTIIHEFGVRAYLRCLSKVVTSRRPITFLECMVRCGNPTAGNEIVGTAKHGSSIY